jgi:hypothetical protein
MTGKTVGKWKVIKRDENKKANAVYWVCECQCGIIASVAGTSLRSGESTQCKKCWLKEVHTNNIGKFAGEGNPFHGKLHSDDTRQKMVQNHADFTGDKNPLLNALKANPDLRHRLSDMRKDWYKNASNDVLVTRARRLSRSMAASDYHKNCSNLKHHESGHYLNKFGDRLFYRSSWERKALEHLDQFPQVVAFKTEPFYIQYQVASDVRFSRPDILVEFDNDKILLIEVKPLALVHHRNNAEKIASYITYCKENNLYFRLITGKFIKDDVLFHKVIEGVYHGPQSYS